LIKKSTGQRSLLYGHPREYGDFLIAIYEEWVRNDVGRVFVMNFERALNAWIGNPHPSVSTPTAAAVRSSSNIMVMSMPVTNSVYPEYKLGNIRTDTLRNDSPFAAVRFGSRKETALPAGAQSARSSRHAGAPAPSTASRPPAMVNRGFTISARDTGNFSFTSGNTATP
jgi:hypothetical protein